MVGHVLPAWARMLMATNATKVYGDELKLKVCPFCHNAKYNFEVNLHNKLWHCWVCDSGGRGLTKLFKVLSIDDTAFVLDDAQDEDFTSERTNDEESISLPEDSVPVLSSVENKNLALAYLYKRKMTDAEIVTWNVMDSPSMWRAIFPFYDKDGSVSWWCGASYGTRSKMKYMFPKGRGLKERAFAFRQGEDITKVVLVEGIFDALNVWRAGYSVLPLWGKFVSDSQMSKLREMNFNEVFVMLDEDAQIDAIRLYDKLKYEFNTKIVKVRSDPDDMSIDEVREAVCSAYVPSLLNSIHVRMTRDRNK